MEPLTETVDLDLEESNDLTFKIKMEGTAMSPAKVRLVCENDDFAYMFNGYGTGEDEVVQFTLPRMDKKLSEGMYKARVEVLVDNRYFAPLQFQINFKKTLSVVAEAIQVMRRPTKPEIAVTASSIVANKSVAPTVSTIKFEQRPESKQVIAQPPQQKVQVEQTSVSAPAPGSLKDVFLKKTQDAALPASLKEKFGR
jgi:hypothetical protein